MNNIAKCDNCGGNYRFDADKGVLLCENCASQVPIEEVPAAPKQLLTATSAPKSSQPASGAEFRCLNCGAPIQADQIIDSKCPFCGTTAINTVDNAMIAIPDAIIPFGVSKERAIGIYKSWIKKKKFAPNDLKKKSSIQKMQGIYYPCWMFDYNTYSHYHGVGVRVHRHRDSNGNSYTTESRHRFNGDFNNNYVNRLEPANDMIQKNNIEQFEDYARQKFVKYDSKYVLGYNTLNYNKGLHQSWDVEKGQAQNEIANTIKRQLGYDRYDSFICNTDFADMRWNYSLLPIWSCEFNYKKKKYNFFVNGKTGAIKGKTPKSGWKIFAMVLGIAAAIGGIVALAMFL